MAKMAVDIDLSKTYALGLLSTLYTKSSRIARFQMIFEH